ncbi:MAG TPA: hypothetical protein DCL44_09900 [Elusimicrobia bacterium]|nr:hypothetical protein [Elusimicrobiota bacterium]
MTYRTTQLLLVLTVFSLNAYCTGPDMATESFKELEQAGQIAALQGDSAASGTIPVAIKPARVGRDLTEEFRLTWDTIDLKLGESEKTELRKYKVLFVRGFLTGGYVQPISLFGKKVWTGPYFNDQISLLKELGVEFKMVDIDSTMPPAHNAKKTAKDIRDSDKPVIIISHSDGGMYVLQALTDNQDLLPNVRGFISLQTPFGGTPIAEYIKDNKYLSAAMAKILAHFGGTVDSLLNLTPEERNRLQESSRGTVREVVSKVNMISFASWKDNEPNKIDTLLELPRDYMLKQGLANDGLVPLESAILPGSDYIKLPGVDHMVPVMAADKMLKFDRRRFTKTLLLMIISKPEKFSQN